MKPPRTKYRAVKCKVGDISFDSKREMKHYAELRLRERAGEIRDLTLQPEFQLWDGGRDRDGKKHRPIVYRADFSYFDIKLNSRVVVDVKGMRLPVYLMKRKMFLVRYPECVFLEV